MPGGFGVNVGAPHILLPAVMTACLLLFIFWSFIVRYALIEFPAALVGGASIGTLLASFGVIPGVAIALGIPATTISRGGVSGGAHSLAEWWSDEDVSIGTQKALLLLLPSAGVR